MWPFSEMSLATATLVGTLANWGLLGSLLSGVICTFVIVQTTDIKEEHWAYDRQHSSERIALLSTQGDQLRKDTAVAVEAAESEKLARLKLEEKLAPRSLSSEQMKKITEQLSAHKGASLDIIVFPAGSADAQPLAGMIDDAVGAAGWNVRTWSAIPSTQWVRGILVSVRSGTEQSSVRPAMALLEALQKAELSAGRHEQFNSGELPTALSGPPWISENAAPIRILIGNKP